MTCSSTINKFCYIQLIITSLTFSLRIAAFVRSIKKKNMIKILLHKWRFKLYCDCIAKPLLIMYGWGLHLLTAFSNLYIQMCNCSIKLEHFFGSCWYQEQVYIRNLKKNVYSIKVTWWTNERWHWAKPVHKCLKITPVWNI